MTVILRRAATLNAAKLEVALSVKAFQDKMKCSIYLTLRDHIDQDIEFDGQRNGLKHDWFLGRRSMVGNDFKIVARTRSKTELL
jgi:hypothetical protein